MPSSSRLPQSDSRPSKERSSSYTSKESHNKHRKSGNTEKHNAASGSRNGKSDRCHGRESLPSFSASLRITSTPPPRGKVDRKEKLGTTLQPKTFSRTDSRPETGYPSAGGNKKVVEAASSTNSRAHTPSQTPSKCPRGRSLTPKIPPYKDFGVSSEKTEQPTEKLPDPYAELTDLVNEEIKESAARTRLGVTGSAQNLPGGTAKTVASPSPSRSPPSAPANKIRGVASNFDYSTSRKPSKDTFVSPDPAMNCKSPVNASSSDRGSSRNGTRTANQRPTSGRRAAGSATGVMEGGQGGTCTTNATRAVGGGRGGNGSRVDHKGRVSPSSKDVASKHSGSRNVAAASPEQMDEDDEEDEKGMPQAVRMPEPTMDEPPTNLEVFRRIHKGRMEKIARNVQPSALMKHLGEAGYFRHDYGESARTTTDNNNLKYGLKKGVERLYLWLSMYNPSDENSNFTKSS